jgi:hypothetical protein
MKNNTVSKISIFIPFYISLIIGFFLNENSSYGALIDYQHHLKIILELKKNVFNTLKNYNNFNTDHSPLLLIILSIIYTLVDSETLMRLFYLHFCLLLPLFFYLCIKKKFKKEKENYLFLFSCVIFVSPYFRSLSIWPGDEIISLIFFTLSIFFYLKFKDYDYYSFTYVILNIFFLALAAYFRPIYSLFSIYFFYNFFTYYNFSVKIIIIIFLYLILSLPAFYFLFFINNFIFFHSNNLSINISNKIIIISTILFFYMIPFILNIIKFLPNIINKIKNIKFLSVFAIFFIINIYFFDFALNNQDYGGGFFFKASNYFFNNNVFLYIAFFFSLLLLYNLILINIINHLLIILVLFFLSPVNYVYNEYYEPLFLFLLFTLFDNKVFLNYFNKIQNLIYLYIFYFFVYIFHIFRNFIL